MNKFYKAEDVIRAIAEYLAWQDNRINKGKNDCIDNWEEWVEDAEDVVYNLQAIKVSEYADKDEAFMKGYAKGCVEGYVKGMATSDIVHCKGCIFWSNNLCKARTSYNVTCEDDFCSFGIRRKDRQ